MAVCHRDLKGLTNFDALSRIWKVLPSVNLTSSVPSLLLCRRLNSASHGIWHFIIISVTITLVTKTSKQFVSPRTEFVLHHPLSQQRAAAASFLSPLLERSRTSVGQICIGLNT